MLVGFIEVIKMFFEMLLWCMKWIFIALIPIVLMVFYYFAYYHRKGYRMKPRSTPLPKKPSFFKRLLIEFPKRFVIDSYERDPDSFNDYGVHLVCGEQGSGKTMTVVYLLQEYKKKYSKLKVKTNFNYLNQDDEINHWRDVVFSNNGIYGEIDVIDEIQTWFSSMQSLNFPVEMLQEISQQRKQRKAIFGTAQVFTKVAKGIREQTTFLYLPITIGGCLTICRKYALKLDSEGQIKEKHLRRTFFFVHTEELRNSYDTYKRIERLSKDGFKDVNNLSTITEKLLESR